MRNKHSVWPAVTAVILILAAVAVAQMKKIDTPALKMLAPDLRVDIKGPAAAAQGEELGTRIKARVQNIGKVAAGRFSVDLVLSGNDSVPVAPAAYSAGYHDDVLLMGGREAVASLAPGASLELTLNGKNKIPGDTPPGAYYLGAVVDSAKAVREMNEGNNVGLWPIRISAGLPDLTVTGFAFSGAPPGGTPDCKLLVTIVNLGAAIPHGSGAVLKVYVEDVLVDTIDIDSDKVEQTAYHDVHNAYDPANPGKSRSVVGTGYYFPRGPARTYRCRGVVDATGVLPESNETNNSFSRNEAIPAH